MPSTAEQTGGSRPEPRGGRLFVWGVYALMLAAALGYVFAFGANVPRWDDLSIVPFLAHPEYVTLGGLWDQQREHRIPLVRLVLLAQLAVTRDARAAMLFNVLSLGLLSWAMIRVAGALRGQVSYTDAVFPLILLHLG